MGIARVWDGRKRGTNGGFVAGKTGETALAEEDSCRGVCEKSDFEVKAGGFRQRAQYSAVHENVLLEA